MRCRSNHVSAGGDGDKVEGAVSEGRLLSGPAGQDRGQRQREPPPLPSPPHRLLKTILDVKDLPLVLRTGITQGEES